MEQANELLVSDARRQGLHIRYELSLEGEPKNAFPGHAASSTAASVATLV
jgi:hypothetical protein